jgi:hypothetical protein
MYQTTLWLECDLVDGRGISTRERRHKILVQLPLAPYCGLIIAKGAFTFSVERVGWDCDVNQFFLSLADLRFHEDAGGFQRTLAKLIADGWAIEREFNCGDLEPAAQPKK